MSKMKPRRIGSAFIDLDPVEVIRGKDQKSRQASLVNTKRGNATGVTNTEPSTGATRSGEDHAGKSPKTIYNNKKSAADVVLQGNSSELAGIAHEAGATKHAISKPQQPEMGKPGNSSPWAAKAKEVLTLSSNLNGESTSRVETAIDNAASAVIKPPEKMQQSSTAVSSRPKRAARKRYTEVDWYEDLRPTDDESSKVDNGHRGSSVSSPEPHATSSPSKPSPPKRKRRQSAQNSSKRRKGTKGKEKTPSKGDAQKLQLPLTAAPTTLPVDSLESDANPTSKNRDVRPGSSGIKRIAEDPVNSPGPKAPEQNPKEGPIGTAQLEIIEISSASPLSTNSTNEPDSDDDMNEATTDKNGAAETEQHGRGKSVGQKLTDALRDAGLTTQHLPATNMGSHLTRTSQWASIPQKSCIPVSCTHPSRDSLEHGALDTDFDLSQVQSNPVMMRQEGSESIEPTVALLDMVPGAYFDTSPPVHGTGACTDNLSSRERHSLSELSSSQASVDMGKDKDVVGSQWMTLHQNPEVVPGSEHSNNDSRHSISSLGKSFRAIIQTRKNDTEGSSRSSAADGPTALLSEESDNVHTPESQKPLLTKETPCRPMPMSIPRSSIVDDNGSPRLIERGRPGSLRFGRLSSLATTDSSTSSHARVSEDRSEDYTPHDRPSLSKFHLDMLLEYGVEAEDLFKRRSRSAFFRSHTTSGGTSIRASRHTEQQSGTRLTTVSPRRTDDSSAVEKGPGNLEQVRASAAEPSSSQRTIDELGLCTNRPLEGHRHLGKLRSIEATSQIQPSSEPPHSIMQDDADGMAWISALQAAQKSAHSLLQQTSQVCLVGCRGFIELCSLIDRISQSSSLQSKTPSARSYTSTEKAAIAFLMISSAHKKHAWSFTDSRCHL